MRVDLRPGCQLRAYTHYSIKCSRLSLFLREYCREVNVKEYVCVQEMFKIYFSSLHIQNWTTIDLCVSVFISNVHLFAAGPSTPSFCSIFLLLDTNYVQERSEVLGGFVPFTGEWTYTHTAISPLLFTDSLGSLIEATACGRSQRRELRSRQRPFPVQRWHFFLF